MINFRKTVEVEVKNAANSLYSSNTTFKGHIVARAPSSSSFASKVVNAIQRFFGLNGMWKHERKAVKQISNDVFTELQKKHPALFQQSPGTTIIQHAEKLHRIGMIVQNISAKEFNKLQEQYDRNVP